MAVPLYPFQRRAVEWSANRSTAAFFLEMRLGKTRTATTWALAKRPRHVLVVAPLPVLQPWRDELRLFGIRPATIHTKQPLPDDPAGWYLTNYEQLFSPGHRGRTGRPLVMPKPAALFGWDVVILDESVRIRNPKAQTTKVCRQYLGPASRFRAVLTGLPNPESSLDFFEQMAFLTGHFCGHVSYWDFRAKMFQPVGYDWAPKLGTLKRIRETVAERAFTLTRKAAGLGNRKIYQKRFVELPPKIRTAYRKLETEFALVDHVTKWAVVRAGWLAQLCGGALSGYEHTAKSKEIISLLRTELSGQQVVVWFRFNTELFAFAGALRKAKIEFRTVTGATKPIERSLHAKRFARRRFPVLLYQIKCGKYGLNLSAADTAIYYSNSPSNDERQQSEDRLEHLEKHQPLLYVDVLVRDTVDEDLAVSLRIKKLTNRALLSRLLKRAKERSVRL